MHLSAENIAGLEAPTNVVALICLLGVMFICGFFAAICKEIPRPSSPRRRVVPISATKDHQRKERRLAA